MQSGHVQPPNNSAARHNTLPAKALTVISAAALQIGIISLVLAVPAINSNQSVCLLPGIIASPLLLILAERAKRNPAGAAWVWRLTWAGRIFLILPGLAAADLIAILATTFGLKVVAVMLCFGAAGVLLTTGGRIAFFILCLIPPVILSYFFGILPVFGYTISFRKPYVAAASLLLLAAAFSMRRIRFNISTASRFILFAVYSSVMFAGIWYGAPGMIFPKELGSDPAIRHLGALERAARDTPFPQNFYAVDEDCSGETAYLSNGYNSPGAIEWRRGASSARPHYSIKGVAEHLVFDCEARRIYSLEYYTGRVRVFHGDDLDAPMTYLPVKLELPCRIHHYPGSSILYIAGDGGRFPWYVTDTKGRLLHRFDIQRLEEIVPLADDTFVSAFKGRAYHIRLDKQKHKLITIKSARLPQCKTLRSLMPIFMHTALDERGGRVFVSDFGTGNIYSVSLPGMAARRIAKLERGVRHMAYAPQFDAVAVGNYITGDIYIIGGDGDIKYRKGIGSRLRGITISRDGTRVYAVSRGGVFEIDLGKLRPALNRKRNH